MAIARRSLTAIAALGFLTGQAPAQETLPDGAGAKSVRIVRTATPPVIDGVLDEEAWQLAAQLEDLHEIQPTEYAPARERTVVYLMYDSEAIYIGARLYDSDPSQVTARRPEFSGKANRYSATTGSRCCSTHSTIGAAATVS